MSTEKKAATGSAIVIIIIVAVLAIMGWSYMTDGDLNPFDNRTVASPQFGDTEIEIEDQGNGTMEMNVDE